MSNRESDGAEHTAHTSHERGGVLECGECRVGLVFDPESEEYSCPKCGWVK